MSEDRKGRLDAIREKVDKELPEIVERHLGRMDPKDPYPLHTELGKRRREAITVGEFLDWLEAEGLVICAVGDGTTMLYWPDRTSKEARIGGFLGIDPAALEAEKQAILEMIRAGQS